MTNEYADEVMALHTAALAGESSLRPKDQVTRLVAPLCSVNITFWIRRGVDCLMSGVFAATILMPDTSFKDVA